MLVLSKNLFEDWASTNRAGYEETLVLKLAYFCICLVALIDL